MNRKPTMGGQSCKLAIYHNYISQIDDKLPITSKNNTVMYIYTTNNDIGEKNLKIVKKEIHRWLKENYITYNFQVILQSQENKHYDSCDWDSYRYKYLLYISWTNKT